MFSPNILILSNYLLGNVKKLVYDSPGDDDKRSNSTECTQ